MFFLFYLAVKIHEHEMCGLLRGHGLGGCHRKRKSEQETPGRGIPKKDRALALQGISTVLRVLQGTPANISVRPRMLDVARINVL